MKKEYYLILDIGGTWLKGTLIGIADKESLSDIPALVEKSPVTKVRSRLSVSATVNDFVEAIKELISLLPDRDNVSGIGISTAGIVNYHGTKLTYAAGHLKALMDTAWIDYLKAKISPVVILINDADAAAIGAASIGYLSGNKVVGVMPVGTGLGFSVWRNGRKWMPNFSMTLLGCTYTPAGYYDSLASASLLSAAHEENDLCAVFTNDLYKEMRDKYICDLAGIITTAHILYSVDKILIGGGLADAVCHCGFPLAQQIKEELKKAPLLTSDTVEIEVMNEGNNLPLIGAALLAIGEKAACSVRLQKKYNDISTETPFDSSLRLEKQTTDDLIHLLWLNEQAAGEELKKSLSVISESVDVIANKLKDGGRLIYIGSGTSGRLAAIDAVELSCTFGFPRDKVLTFISGGVADAAIDIETGFEEDASSVPELLLANISSSDVVIGISVSGSAYYVQSGLGFAKFIGAHTIMIQEQCVESLPFCHRVIPLRSGNEILAGSTRMKAGTATKKVLNFISTSVMIRLGKVHGCYMTELECINEKLVKRALHILQALYPMSEDEAYDLLSRNNFKLNQAIRQIG